METMAENVGKSYNDKDVQLLEKYFREKFLTSTIATTETSASEPSKPTTSPTETTMETTITSKPITTSEETQLTTTLGEERSYFLPVVAIAVIITAIVLVVATRK